jgi:hypothetical protein
VSRQNNQPIQKKIFLKEGLPAVGEHPEIFLSKIPSKIRPLLITQRAIQGAMTPAVTLHQIREVLMIKAFCPYFERAFGTTLDLRKFFIFLHEVLKNNAKLGIEDRHLEITTNRHLRNGSILYKKSKE